MEQLCFSALCFWFPAYLNAREATPITIFSTSAVVRTKTDVGAEKLITLEEIFLELKKKKNQIALYCCILFLAAQ